MIDLRRKVIPECWLWEESMQEIDKKITDEQIKFMVDREWSLGAAYIGMLTIYEKSNYLKFIGGLMSTLLCSPGQNLIGEDNDQKVWKQYATARTKAFFDWLDEQMGVKI